MHKTKSSKTDSSTYSNSSALNSHPQLAHRPFGSEIQKASVAAKTPTDIEDEGFAEQQMEATGLEIQAKYGSITPEGQERLTVLQAKMNGLLNSRLVHARCFGHNIANIPLKRPDTPIQAKLSIGEPGDKYEQEADETARQVVQRIYQPQSKKLQRESLPEEENELQMRPEHDIQREALPEDEELQMKPEGSVQRESLPDEEEELQMQLMVQRVADGGMAASPDVEVGIQRARGSGQPLADNIREPMEQAFGADFSRVKVHTDPQADQLNKSIQAKAFTTGQDVFFQQGAYEPGSRGGQELLAHELTHVVQQSGSDVQLSSATTSQVSRVSEDNQVIQRRVGFEFEVGWQVRRPPQTKEEKKQVADADRKYARKMKIGQQAVFDEKWKKLHPSLRKLLYKITPKPTDEKARQAYLQKRIKEGISSTDAQNELIEMVDYISAQMNIPKAAKIMAPPDSDNSVPNNVAAEPLWHLTADMNAGSSQLEWVTEPLENIGQVQKSMGQITAMGTKLENLATDHKVIKSEQLADVGSVKEDYIASGFGIYPQDPKLKAAPQVTGGFRLDQVANMMQEVLDKKGAKKDPKAIYSAKVNQAGSNQESNSINQALTEAKKVKDLGYSDEMQGLVALILNYLWQAEKNSAQTREALANSKGIANAFMSRTDFVHNYNQTPESKDQNMSSDEFLKMLKNVTELDMNEKVFPTGFKERASDRESHQLDLTRQEWLINIAKGVDLLKKDQGDEQRKHLHSSLGALGEVDDEVGEDGNKVKAVVIELRRMQDAQPLENWQKVAENAFNFIEELNKRPKK